MSGNGGALDIVVERFLFMTIVTLRGTVGIVMYVDVDMAVLDMVPCNGSMKQVPRGFRLYQRIGK